MVPNPRLLSGLVILVAGALALSGCGASTTKSAAPSCTPGSVASAPDPSPLDVAVSPVADAVAKLPAVVKAKGTLTVATDASYAPNEFTAEGSEKIIGMDVDLGTAIAKALGLKVNFVNASFDGILAGIQAGRYDASMSSFTDNSEREQTVDFVTYYQAGTGTMVRKCNPKNIKSDTDLCGLNVGAENGTVQLDALQKEDADGSVVKECKAAGKPAPNAQGFPKQTDVNQALAAGRIDAYLADSPVVDYAVKKTGDAFEKAGENTGVAPYGIALPKNAGTTREAVQAALQSLINDGTYKKILDNWGVASGAIATAKINGAQ